MLGILNVRDLCDTSLLTNGVVNVTTLVLCLDYKESQRKEYRLIS